ncbi:MAG: quinolinate synthase NadA [Myxococcota bacterium]
MNTPFPSLRIGARKLVPQGSFAEAQAAFLHPDAATVTALDELLTKRNAGIVAHFYMDAELQGVLSALTCPHVAIADSLKMADDAVKMAEAGVELIAVLGVDFMSENVRAVLDAQGFEHVNVVRLAEDAIGCSLAESAQAPAYEAWLDEAKGTERALHVIYINTSLRTKAQAHHRVPTITCTSSNVVQTVLQAAAQIEDISVFYGPDTYMGGNLHAMFTQFQQMPLEVVRQLHPDHTPDTLAALVERFYVFDKGTCIVHHMFGTDVVRRVEAEHGDALLTAHLEVPGEMFALAAQAQASGRGVVGSTSNILGFITEQVDEAVKRPSAQHLPVVLGTEAGMITSIVGNVQKRLVAHGREDVDVEIIFPVANEAVAQTDDVFGVVPGVAAGEGCSVAGGCATCPFMKMNDLDALFHVLEKADDPSVVRGYEPQKYTETIAGRTVADLGSEPILHMRHFQRTGRMSDALVEAVTSR